jgi:hypothetical protein
MVLAERPVVDIVAERSPETLVLAAGGVADVGLIRDVRPAADIVADMVRGATEILSSVQRRPGGGA